jgi:hypothetical protein
LVLTITEKAHRVLHPFLVLVVLPVVIDPSAAPVNQTHRALIVEWDVLVRAPKDLETTGLLRVAMMTTERRQTDIAMIALGTTTTIMIDTGTMIAIGNRTGPGTHRGATNGVRRDGGVEIEIALVNDLQIAEAVTGRTVGALDLKEEVVALGVVIANQAAAEVGKETSIGGRKASDAAGRWVDLKMGTCMSYCLPGSRNEI